MYPSFQDYFKAVRPKVDKALGEELSNLIGGDHGRAPAPLRIALQGGKRIRGCLLCLVADALGGRLESAVSRAVAVELIHTASLIHDDFIDQDSSRRGQPAAWTLIGARRAVLLGDVIFASAIEMMNRVGREEGLVVSGSIAQISKGAFQERLDPQVLANEIETCRFDGAIYDKIISLKTGVLFGASCILGALTAGAGPEICQMLQAYGTHTGAAYQIADDLKEVRSILAAASVAAREAAELAPVLLYFLEDARPHILPWLGSDSSTTLTGPAASCLRTLEGLMESEIEIRLRSAESAISAGLPENAYLGLMRRTPRDMIRMFNESHS
jgi:geranylgeranyl pyrophosphate synthase